MHLTIALDIRKLAAWYREKTGIQSVRIVGRDGAASEKTIQTVLRTYIEDQGTNPDAVVINPEYHSIMAVKDNAADSIEVEFEAVGYRVEPAVPQSDIQEICRRISQQFGTTDQ